MKPLLTLWLASFLAAPLLCAEGVVTADEVAARIVQREHEVARSLERFHPIAETYIQVMSSPHNEPAVSYDRYFVSLAGFRGGLHAERFKSPQMEAWRAIGDYSDSLKPTTLEYDPSGFVAMAYPDPSTFDMHHYQFRFVTTEFLGNVRCLVFDVSPSAMRKSGLFQGRIWVEDRDFTIVRFNGIYKGSNVGSKYFHFDSWRTEAKPRLWVPTAIYSQETALPCCGIWKLNWTNIRFKAQTRFWGYHLDSPGDSQEMAEIFDEPSGRFREVSFPGTPEQLDPQQAWQRQSETDVLDRLERIGLVSPTGEVEKILQTVVNNLEVTNNISVEPEIRCRILLTANLESAVVGHTILISRGLIDVVPDETSLAAVLAHNLALITIQDRTSAKFFWPDQLMFDRRDATKRLRFIPSPDQEEQASSLAHEWMLKSPYRDSLNSVTRFTAELRSRAPHISRLLKANLGDSLSATFDLKRAAEDRSQTEDANQVRALPLGSRIVVDPWSGKTTLLKVAGNEIRPKSENLPFEITPVFLELRRGRDAAIPAVAITAAAAN